MVVVVVIMCVICLLCLLSFFCFVYDGVVCVFVDLTSVAVVIDVVVVACDAVDVVAGVWCCCCGC